MTKSLKALCVLFFALLLLGGCAGKKQAKLITDFKADFQADYRGQELSGSLTYNRQGRMNMRLSSPGGLDGLSVGYSDSELRLGKDGLQCTADEAYLPSSSFPASLKSVLEEICRDEENGRLSFSDGRAKVGEWELETNEEGFPVSLGNKDCTITFENPCAL